MKRPNGTGGVRKLSGRRTKPFQAVVSQMEDGSRVQKSLGVFRTKKEALEALAQYSVDPINLDARSWTFSDVYSVVYAEAKPSIQLRLSTAYNRCEDLHGKRCVDITVSDLDRAAASLAGKSAQTQLSMTILFSRVYEHLLRHNAVRRDLSQYVKMPEPAKKQDRVTLDKNEIEYVISRQDSMTILLYTGMRINEMLNLKLENVHFGDYPYLDIVKSKTPSGIRKIPIHKDIMPIVEKAKGEYLVEPHITYNGYMDHWKGIEKTPRAFRRTFSTYAKSSGMDDFYRRAIMGHSQKGLTDEVYTDALLPDLYREMQKLSFK